MTAEDLHDALTLLPADLVAEADKRRSRIRSASQWHRWAAMAACFCLVIGCGFLMHTWMLTNTKTSQAVHMAARDAAPAEAAPEREDQESSMEAARTGAGSRFNALDTGTLAPGIGNITWVETPEDGAPSGNPPGMPMVTLIQDPQMLEEYLANEKGEGLRESSLVYDEAWFAAQDLLLIRLTCPVGTTVGDIQEAEGQWTVNLQPSRLSLLARYHILMEVEKGSVESADHVTISYEEP